MSFLKRVLVRRAVVHRAEVGQRRVYLRKSVTKTAERPRRLAQTGV